MSTFVGVDGGGTHARAVVVSGTGTELARVTGPAGIVDARDPAGAAVTIARLVRAALAAAGAGPPAAVLCCGLAGAGRGTEREAVAVALMLDGVAEKVTVIGDAEIAMHDAFNGGPGLLLVSGTGSIAWAQNTGPALRVGGWGSLLGDEGSGYAIGLGALRAVMRAHDGREPPTALAGSLLAATCAAHPEGLVAWAAAASKRDIAGLAPAVLECAAAGDVAAAAIRERAVTDLAALAIHAAHSAALSAPALALAGGLLAPGGPLRAPVSAAIADVLPDARLVDAVVDAARGAAAFARAASTATPSDAPAG